MAELTLVRHGQAGDVMGDYDRLSALGHRQAAQVGPVLAAGPALDQAWSGAMRRHQESAADGLQGLAGAPPVQIDPRWNEFDHQEVIRVGLAAGLGHSTSPGVIPSFFSAAMARWADPDHAHEYNEPYAVFYERVVAGLDALCAGLGHGERAVVFTSGGVISAVCRSLLGLSPLVSFEINLVLFNSGLTRLRVSGARRSLVQLNLSHHLEGEAGLLTRS
jgi:broad specificity phosphatase PhoE